MTRLDTKPTIPGLRAGTTPTTGMATLIEVPRLGPRRGQTRRLRKAARSPRTPGRDPRSRAEGRARSAKRPRRRLRRGVRLAGWSLLILASMAGTFTLGWTNRGGRFGRLPLLSAAESLGVRAGPSPWGDVRPAGGPSPESEMVATGPAVGAPAADADVPVIFPGYVVPDDSLEEAANEGS